PAMTKRIEAVAVDFGGVLAQTPTDEAFARLAAAVGIEDDGLADAWLRHRLEYDLDALDPAQYWSLVGGRGYDGSALEELLVDDREENVAAAGGLGFESVLFTTVDELRRELEVRFAGELPLP